MESSNWRKIARSPSYNALDQAAVADSHNPPGASSISSAEDTMIHSLSPSPPAQRRSYAAIAADSEPPTPSEVQKLELSAPVKSISIGTGRPGPPRRPPRRSSSQEPSRTGDEPEPTISESLHAFSRWNDTYHSVRVCTNSQV
jgi:hypothetical protein